MVVRPWIESLSPRSANAFSTIAVLLSESRNPQKMHSCQGSPTSVAPNQTTRSTAPTWIGAATKSRRRNEASCTNENSIPIVNSRRTTPISANTWTVPISEMRFSPFGPINAPATRNPAIDGSRN
jgi:hypothetical protein